MKTLSANWKKGERGFTLIELLVVVAIIGALAAVAVPNIGRFLNQGKDESYETELHNVQMAVSAMLFESSSHLLDNDYTGISDMDDVTADNNTLQLSDYVIGLNEDGTVKTGCTYTISQDGGVILQSIP